MSLEQIVAGVVLFVAFGLIAWGHFVELSLVREAEEADPAQPLRTLPVDF